MATRCFSPGLSSLAPDEAYRPSRIEGVDHGPVPYIGARRDREFQSLQPRYRAP